MMMSGKTTRFNPSEHLRQIERRQRQPDGSYQKVSNDYLDVKWRLVWFREEHPDGSIQTDLLSQPGVSPAVVKATVTLENGVTATGFGQCGTEDWGDWLEKAETRSIGRALALLGFGTQFCEDFDEIITDAPVEPRQQRPTSPSNGQPAASAEPGNPMTPNQRRYIESLARDAGMDQPGLEQTVNKRYGRTMDELPKSEASALIEALQAIKDEQSLAGYTN
jgi:hypothetical protein